MIALEREEKMMEDSSVFLKSLIRMALILSLRWARWVNIYDSIIDYNIIYLTIIKAHLHQNLNLSTHISCFHSSININMSINLF